MFGTYNVLKCAHELNISKIIMASSAPVDLDVDSKSSEQAKDEEQPCCSTNQDFVYDLTKNLQEHEASIFSKTFNMNIIVLRLGHIVDGQRGTDLNNIRLCDVQYCRGGWVSKYDVARAFARAVECGCAGYNMFNIIGSYQAKEKFDMSNTKKVLNFKCEEQFFDC